MPLAGTDYPWPLLHYTSMRLLDLFCGAGGAAMGYHRAGFELVGVDLHPQPNYPFEFIQADVIELEAWPIVDAIHASPPCQRFSRLAKLRRGYEWPDLLTPTRELLRAYGVPYVIENVPGAPLIDPLLLCGSMFGLQTIVDRSPSSNSYLRVRPRQLRRHRMFECSFDIAPPHPCLHRGEAVGVYGRGGGVRTRGTGGYQGKSQECRDAMGIDWMTHYELTQAIPPAYTEYIGNALRNVLLHR